MQYLLALGFYGAGHLFLARNWLGSARSYLPIWVLKQAVVFETHHSGICIASFWVKARAHIHLYAGSKQAYYIPRNSLHLFARLEGGCHCEMAVGGELNLNRLGIGLVLLICGTLVYYHCTIRTYPVVSLAADVLIVLLCSLSILGLLFRYGNVSVPIDPLEWEVSQETADRVAACIANAVGAAVSVLRVAAKGQDKKLFLKVAVSLYFFSALGRATSGATVAYLALCLTLLLFCMSKLAPAARVS